MSIGVGLFARHGEQMTAEALAGYREQCIASGMDDFIAKPVKMGDLVTALEKYRPTSSAPQMAPELDAP